MATGQYTKLNSQDSTQFRKGVDSYGTNTNFFTASFNALQIGKFKETSQIKFLDAMSGPGKFSNSVKEKLGSEKALTIKWHFNDFRKETLDKIAYGEKINCNVLDIAGQSSRFDIAVVRYGIKDLPKEQQQAAIFALFNVLNPGGRLVIPDMIAFTPEAQGGINKTHLAKQVHAGRDVKTEGVCHIPLDSEWHTYLENAGFSHIKIQIGFTSDVKSTNWKGQFGKNADEAKILSDLDSIIMAEARANPIFANEYKISYLEDEKCAFISHPIAVISATKE